MELTGKEIKSSGSRRFLLRLKIVVLFLLLVVLGWWLLVPVPVFEVPYSTVVLDRNDRIVGMTVARDEQFRLRDDAPLPAKYVSALVAFEDKRFFRHGGVDVLAAFRALWLNVKYRKIVSGGSTLSMQVVRLSRSNPPRTLPEKIREMLLALRLEQRYTKPEILQLYARHAPFGGNIVGLSAASIKYFNRSPEELSWAEAALLAVLPNAPALIFPGRNNPRLKEKRDRLLDELYRQGSLSQEDLVLAQAEPLPERIYQSESIVPHVLGRALLERPGETTHTFIDGELQQQVNAIVSRHTDILRHNHIYNAAVLVAHIPTGEVRAYVGNAPERKEDGGHQVDVITARRSSGSILKPALYALMQQSGHLLPGTLVSDVPSRFGSYVPENFNKSFQGAVPADAALATSLNIPFVRLLREYGVAHFYDNLKEMGITTLNRTPGNYGLSLILGGAECTLWDVCNMYGGMVSVLRHYRSMDGLQLTNEYQRLRLWQHSPVDSVPAEHGVLDAASIWLTLKALQEVERPDMEAGWKSFASSGNLAWKTGTSFGFRDAWAVGVNPEYVIGVWVGNANGEGRPGLTGVRTAAPVLFEVAALLRTTEHLYAPTEVLQSTVVCRHSGHRASSICPETDTIRTTYAASRSELCPYHRLVHLDATGKYRVNASCEPVHRIQTVPWFVLSPLQEWYYAHTHANYKKLPPYRSDCREAQDDIMEMIYPQRGLEVFIPKDWGGVTQGVIFEVAHREPATLIYWHIDDQYMGSTRNNHQLEVDVEPGKHVLYLVDEKGNELRQSFGVSE